MTTNGLGYHEYLQFCEDAGIDAMYVFNCGMTCQGRNPDYFDEDLIEEFYQDDRAAKFYQLVRYSYASGLDSFGSQPHSIWSDFPMIDMAARRLQKVVIENKDFEKLIRQYDRPVSFFIAIRPILQRRTITRMLASRRKTTSDCEIPCLAFRESFLFTVIAKDYDMSAQEMNGWLRCIGVQYKLRCGTWVLYQAYVGNGYTKSKTIVYDAENCKTRVHTCWTQKGRRFIYEKLKAYGVLPVCERGEDYENPSIPD